MVLGKGFCENYNRFCERPLWVMENQTSYKKYLEVSASASGQSSTHHLAGTFRPSISSWPLI